MTIKHNKEKELAQYLLLDFLSISEIEGLSGPENSSCSSWCLEMNRRYKSSKCSPFYSLMSIMDFLSTGKSFCTLVISTHMQISDSVISLHYMLYVNWNAKTHAQLMIDTPWHHCDLPFVMFLLYRNML